MTDPVLCIVVYAAFIAVLSAVHYFKTLATDLWSPWRTALLIGIVVMIVLLLARTQAPVLLGCALTLGALYIRHTGDETEPSDAMLLGSVTGATAVLPFVVLLGQAPRVLAAGILAGAVAGYGVTFALLHVADKKKQIAFDVVTAAIAIAAAWLPRLLAREGISDLHILFATATLLPLLVLIALFRQWPDIRTELRDEASLGFIDARDVRATAHPFLRLGRAGWTDSHAHRQFVRLANRIALRKRQQRFRSDDTARLHQLEIIKLRMQLQEMSRIDRAMLARRADDEGSSDTMPTTHEG